MKVLLAMSGGLDSSVALILLKKQYDVVGTTLRLYDSDEETTDGQKVCCSLRDVQDAKSVATKFDIDHYTFNFLDSFKKEVIDRFVCTYKNGETPNPCIECNRYIKFGELFGRAKVLKCDYLATGHYARIQKDESSGRWLLKKALDLTKDQSYVLYNLTQEQLSKTIFPMGEMKKSDARVLADEYSLVNAHKPDSQDICFVPNGKYAEFIEGYTHQKFPQGNFIDKDGNVLGTHKGICHYTIGQRKGLGIALGEPVFVTKIDVKNNTVTLGKSEDLFSRTLIATDLNFISIEKLDSPLKTTAKTRYKQAEQPCTLYPLEGGNVKVVFETPQRAITKGQAVVFYDGDIVVGGGKIMSCE